MGSEQIMKLAVSAMEERKGLDITVLDLKDISPMTDYFVICHGTSDVQVKTITAEIRKSAAENDIVIKNIEGNDKGRWVLIDMGDVVAHIFHREDREYYNLERLWSDAKVVEIV